MPIHLGDVIDGKYRIVRLLGEGGMGAVYEGENTRIHRRVAIKVLHSNVASNADAMTRFEREAQAAGRIGSEHIVEVLDMGDLLGGERYLVMEFLEGEALSDRIAEGRMEPSKVAALMVQLLEGLSAAHAAGIVHRDLKPDNVFLLVNRSGKRDFVKIVDFGISKFAGVGPEMSMTRTGVVMGTPYYMAPEQARGGKGVDHRVDIYAVGVILYQAVVGKVPFDAETFNELLFKIALETPPPLAEEVPGIDPAFAIIVAKAMEREPDGRYQTAHELRDDLVAWLGGAPVARALTLLSGSPGVEADASASDLTRRNLESPGAGPQASSTAGSWATATAPHEDVQVPVSRQGRPLLWGGLTLAVACIFGLWFVNRGGSPPSTSNALPESGTSERVEAPATPVDRPAAVAPLVAKDSAPLGPTEDARLAPSPATPKPRAGGEAAASKPQSPASSSMTGNSRPLVPAHPAASGRTSPSGKSGGRIIQTEL